MGADKNVRLAFPELHPSIDQSSHSPLSRLLPIAPQYEERHVSAEIAGLLNAPSSAPAPHPFSAIVAKVAHLQGMDDVGAAVLYQRMIQSFHQAPATYAIARSRSRVVRGRVEDVIDRLAMSERHAGRKVVRLDEGNLLIDGAGIFIHATGRNEKRGCCRCQFEIWADTPELAEDTAARLLRLSGEPQAFQQQFVLHWYFTGIRGELMCTALNEPVREILHDEAYAGLGEPVVQLLQRFLDAEEVVLVLLGPPGTGKTRLVRYLLGMMSRRKGESAEVVYTSDKQALDSGAFLMSFVSGDKDALVVEDADHLLQARSRGNEDMHRFLAIADGVIREQDRKIIFTTNLPNIGDIDEALLRPGRCFGVVRTRALSVEETERLIKRLCTEPQACQRAQQLLFASGARTATVAEVYRACRATPAAAAASVQPA